MLASLWHTAIQTSALPQPRFGFACGQAVLRAYEDNSEIQREIIAHQLFKSQVDERDSGRCCGRPSISRSVVGQFEFCQG